jgi:hypothetical protein
VSTRWLAIAALSCGGCSAYQRDRATDLGYVSARLVEVATDPFHPNNVRYAACFAALLAIGLAGLALVLRAALRTKPGPRDR